MPPRLVTHESNGLVSSREELAEQLHTLLRPSGTAVTNLEKLADGVAAAEAGRPRWAENWNDSAAPLLLGASEGAARRTRLWILTVSLLAFPIALVALAVFYQSLLP